MIEILSASSILLAVIGILFGLWNKELSDILKEKIEKHKEERELQREKQLRSLLSKSIPLFMLSFMTLLIFSPVAIQKSMWIQSLRHFSIKELISNYDPLYASLMMITLFLLLFVSYSGYYMLKIITKIKKRNED
jgi:flagellar biosynthesis protein FlhB